MHGDDWLIVLITTAAVALVRSLVEVLEFAMLRLAGLCELVGSFLVDILVD